MISRINLHIPKVAVPVAITTACFFFLHSCTGKIDQTAEEVVKTSLDAVGTKADREKMKNLVSLADCISPKGKYSTEIHTDSGGYAYFKQAYSYSPTAFEVVIENKTAGYIIGEPVKPLSKEAIYAVRSHQFQNMILEVEQRFHDRGKPEKLEFEGKKTYRLAAKDEMNNECSLFFNAVTGLLSAIHFQNPDSRKEIIKTKFSEWKRVQGLLLPFRIDIDQSEKKYIFNFTKIIFNGAGFYYKKIQK